MRILRCHIDDFGVLHNLDLDFEDTKKIKEIYAPNGWGKSTFAAFIRSMFFGFSANQSRKILENDRMRYLPWNKGVCGGSIIFSSNDKKYKVNRTFGKKASEDTFALYNADTNLPSKDYSSNLGEEIFKIDRESFIKTIYVDHMEVNSVSPTNSINAKIGGVSDVENDLKNLDAALEKCKNYINSHSDTRKTGSLSDTKEEISRLKRVVAEKSSIDKAISDHLKEKEDITAELKKLQDRQKKITEEKKKLADTKQLIEQVDRYSELLRNEKTAKQELETSLEYFCGDVISEENINNLYDMNEGLKDILHKKDEAVNRKTLVDLAAEEEYKTGIETLKQEITSLGEKIERAKFDLENAKAERDTKFNEYNDLNQAVVKLESEIKNRTNSKTILEENVDNEARKAERINQRVRDAEERYKTLLSKKEEIEKQNTLKQLKAGDIDAENKKKKMIITSVSAIVLVIGIVLLIMHAPTAVAVVVTVLGVLGLTIGLLVISGSQHGNNSEMIPVTGFSLDEEISRARREADNVAKEAEEQIEIVSKARQRLHEFDNDGSEQVKMLAISKEKLSVVYSDYEDLKNNYENQQNAINQLKNDFIAKKQKKESDEENHRKNAVESAEKETARLEDVRNYSNKAHTEAVEILEKINKYIKVEISLLNTETAPAVFDTKIQEIRSKVQEHNKLRDIYEESVKKTIDFAERNPQAVEYMNSEEYTSVDNKDDSETTSVRQEADTHDDNLDIELDFIVAKTEELNERIRISQSNLDGIIQSRDEITEAEESLIILEESLKEGKKKLEIVKKTRDFLEESRATFISKHMSPVQKGFDRYYELLTGEKQTLMSLNAHMELVLTVNSDEKKIEALSSGYRDLIGLCYRMALTDEMYASEKPFIILDDPLSNLDDTKIKNGQNFLKKLSDEYQIIYLTCNQSRKII